MFTDDDFLYIIGNPHALVVITPLGRLHVMKAPFALECIEDIGELKAHTIVYADEVISTAKEGIVFLFGVCAYHLKHFRISTPF